MGFEARIERSGLCFNGTSLAAECRTIVGVPIQAGEGCTVVPGDRRWQLRPGQSWWAWSEVVSVWIHSEGRANWIYWLKEH